jgi:hypothetical protein
VMLASVKKESGYPSSHSSSYDLRLLLISPG